MREQDKQKSKHTKVEEHSKLNFVNSFQHLYLDGSL